MLSNKFRWRVRDPKLKKAVLYSYFKEIPPEILGPTWQDVRQGKGTAANPKEILSYYSRIRAGKRPLNEVKLILLGRGGVGKTSLVNRLVHRTFDPNSANLVTPDPFLRWGH